MISYYKTGPLFNFKSKPLPSVGFFIYTNGHSLDPNLTSTVIAISRDSLHTVIGGCCFGESL